MSVMGLGEKQQTAILRTVAAVLHLGNILFSEKGNYAQIAQTSCKFSILIYLYLLIFIYKV